MAPWALHLFDHGVPKADLARGRPGVVVYNALVRTATAAVNAGWSQAQWQDALTDVKRRSPLWDQLRLRDGKRLRSPLSVQKDLDKAWAAADAWLRERDAPWTREDVAHEVRQRVAALRLVLADLSDDQRHVLAFATSEAERRLMTRVTLPRRDIVAATGVPERRVRTSLARLVEVGLLDLHQLGRRGAPGGGAARATIYALPTADRAEAYQCRGTRPMGRPAQTYGTPGGGSVGTSLLAYGTAAGAPAFPVVPAASDADRSAFLASLDPATRALVEAVLDGDSP